MEKMVNKSIAARKNKTSYKNFNVAVYCMVSTVNEITDFEEFDKKFKHLYENVNVGRVYLECYRAMEFADKEHILKVKEYFESKGIATSGGITTCDDSNNEGYVSLCYSSEKGQKILKDSVALNAEVFDEFIFDVRDVEEKYYLSEKVAKYVLAGGTKGFRTSTKTDLDVARPLLQTMHKMHRAGVDNYVTHKGRIRKLTPRECLRLMGFKDSFKIVVSDTSMYQQSGNSIVVDVLIAILKQMDITRYGVDYED